MNEELKITKEDLVNWIDRPPSNGDLDLCEYLSNAVQNRRKYFEEKQKLQNNWNELKNGLQSLFDFERGIVSEEYLDCVKDTLDKIQALERRMLSDKNRY